MGWGVIRRLKAKWAGMGHYKDCDRLANGSLWFPGVLRKAG